MLKKVLIGCPVKNAARWLPRNMAAIDALDYPREDLSYSYVYSQSKDDTLNLLFNWLRSKRTWSLKRVEITAPARLPPKSDEAARFRQWESVNRTLKSHYKVWQLKKYIMSVIDDEDYYFNVDSDVIYMPPETLKVLVEKDVDIVAPYIYIDSSNDECNEWAGKHQFYDTWCYRFKGVPWDNNCHTAIKMKEKADPDTGLIPMDSVGANPVLIKREVIEEVEYHGDEAIVGFCFQARKFGFKIYAYPALECIHAWEAI